MAVTDNSEITTEITGKNLLLLIRSGGERRLTTTFGFFAHATTKMFDDAAKTVNILRMEASNNPGPLTQEKIIAILNNVLPLIKVPGPNNQETKAELTLLKIAKFLLKEPTESTSNVVFAKQYLAKSHQSLDPLMLELLQTPSFPFSTAENMDTTQRTVDTLIRAVLLPPSNDASQKRCAAAVILWLAKHQPEELVKIASDAAHAEPFNGISGNDTEVINKLMDFFPALELESHEVRKTMAVEDLASAAENMSFSFGQ